jgi:hypothetical protein
VSKAQNQFAIKLPSFHPLAEMFPLLEGKEFGDFVADIGEHGLLNDVDTWQGMILEGRNRARACQQLGIEPRYHERQFESQAAARDYVISQNAHRRHLSPEWKDKFLAGLINENRDKSNRAIAAEAKKVGMKVDKNKIAKKRNEMIATGETAPVEKTIGKDGKARKQPAQKARKQSMRPRPSMSTPAVVPASDWKPTPVIGMGSYDSPWWDQDPQAIAEQMAAHMTRDQISHLFALAMDAVKAKQSRAAKSEHITAHSTMTQTVSLEA